MDAPLDYANVNPRSDRRTHVRRRISLLAYADLGMENGGIVLDLGEGGMAVQAVVPLSADALPRIRFQLPETVGWIETSGRVAWLSESKRDGGIEFTALTPSAREKIQAWISAGAAAEDLRRERRTAPRAAAEKSDGSPESPAAPADRAHAPQAPAEPPKEAALDLMISTAEFSTTEGMEGKQPFAVPASSMVPPAPPFPEQRPLEERFPGCGLAGKGVAGEGLAGEGVVGEGPAGRGVAGEGFTAPDFRAPIPPVIPSVGKAAPRGPVPTAAPPTPARPPLRQPPPGGPHPMPGSLFDRENGPDLRLFGHAAEHDLARPRRSRVGIAAVVIVLALASFFIGMRAAQGSFDPAFSTFKSRVGGLWSTVSQAASGNSAPAPAATAPSQNTHNDPSAQNAPDQAAPNQSPPNANTSNNQAAPAGNPPAAVNPPTTAASPPQAPAANPAVPPAGGTASGAANGMTGGAPNSPTTGGTAPPSSAGLAGVSSAASAPAATTFTTPDGITIRSQQLVAIPIASDADSQNQVLQIGRLTHRVDPVYPPEAKLQWIEGTVKLRAATAPDGSVVSTDVISGDSRLAAAAQAAVRGWRYAPTLIDGKPVPTEEQITFTFRLPRTGEPTP